jgi:hypothetical protein
MNWSPCSTTCNQYIWGKGLTQIFYFISALKDKVSLFCTFLSIGAVLWIKTRTEVSHVDILLRSTLQDLRDWVNSFRKLGFMGARMQFVQPASQLASGGCCKLPPQPSATTDGLPLTFTKFAGKLSADPGNRRQGKSKRGTIIRTCAYHVPMISTLPPFSSHTPVSKSSLFNSFPRLQTTVKHS